MPHINEEEILITNQLEINFEEGETFFYEKNNIRIKPYHRLVLQLILKNKKNME